MSLELSAYCLLIGELNIAAIRKALPNAEERNGVLSISSSEYYEEDKHEVVDQLLDELLRNHSLLKQEGVEKIVVHLNLAYQGQCNWELRIDQIEKLHTLNAVFTFSAYTVS